MFRKVRVTFEPDVLQERHLVDRIALALEHAGLPPIAGRILGRLLLCDPPEQSSAGLADYLSASRGAVSTMTRLLVDAGLVERIRIRGSRATWFRIRTGLWAEMLQREVVRVQQFRALAHEGLELLADAPPERRLRLQEFLDFNEFFAEELPSLIEHWKQRQEAS